MTLSTIKKYILAGAACLFVAVAGAVPARMGWRSVTQPDGSTIKVATFGDERFHYTVNEDNRLVVTDADGFYRFATVNDRGGFDATEYRAVPEAQLSASARDFLASSSTEQMIASAQLRRDASEAFKAPRRVPSNMLTSAFPSEGEQPVLVVLVEYQDVKFTIPNPREYYTRMLNEEGFSDDNGTGSARDYFIASSNGKFRPRFDVYRPITLSNKMAYYGANYYGANDTNPAEMAIEATMTLDPEVDFSQYDCDGDGFIDNVFVIYAGKGEADGGSSDSVWPHAYWIYKSNLRTVYLDGKILDHYACSNELSGRDVPCGIGTTVHEFSHVMGLPDLYSTAYNNQHTPMSWSVLDQGCYLNDGRTPPVYSAFERLSMGWIEPIELTKASDVMLPALDTNVAFLLPTSDTNEFFLFENRQRNGWDSYLPYHGMLIWRIAYNAEMWSANTLNNEEPHRVDLIEAGGKRTSFDVPISATSDPWPGTMRKSSFTATSSPAFTTLNGTAINTPLTSIAEKNGIVTFQFNGGGTRVAAPTQVKASDIEGRSATISWTGVAGASSYLLTVIADGATLPTLNHVNVGNVTSYTIQGLTPDTHYTASVMAVGTSCVSDESTEVEFTTAMPGFTDIPVKANAATNVSDNTFTASWEPLAGAQEYFLAVNTITPATTFLDIANYDNSVLAEGWTSTASGKYVIPTNCGAASPSFRFNKFGESIISPVREGGVNKVTFWVRGTNAASIENKVSVYGLTASDAWDKISDEVISMTGRTITVMVDATKRYRAIKLEYTGTTTGSYPIAIDDVAVSGGNPASTQAYLDKFSVGDATSYTVSVTDNTKTYSYIVTASDGYNTSLPSDEILVKFGDDNSGITDIATDDDSVAISGGQFITISGTEADASVYNIAGRTVYYGPRRTITLPAGLYIVKVGSTVKKVIVNR